MSPEPRLCACGCGTELDDRPNRLYVDSTHRKAAWRERTGYHVVGRQERQKASQRRKSRRSGRQVSYRKAVEVLTRYLIDEAGWQGSERMVRAEIGAVVARALPERQRP